MAADLISRAAALSAIERYFQAAGWASSSPVAAHLRRALREIPATVPAAPAASDHAYFTVEETSYTIPRRGALAIYCGDRSRRNKNGSTSHSLRAPLLLMPPEMFSDPRETMQKIAAALNANAAEFFSSAKENADG